VCIENAVQVEVQGNDELKDEELNEAYKELLTQEFNPDAADFEDDNKEASGDQN
jgi:uncharacterized protein YecT (DUF1311 family)